MHAMIQVFVNITQEALYYDNISDTIVTLNAIIV